MKSVVKNCLYEYMLIHNISVKELSEKTGLSEVRISNIRNNYSDCYLSTFLMIADALDISLDLLLCRSKDHQIKTLRDKIGSIVDPLDFYEYLLRYQNVNDKKE